VVEHPKYKGRKIFSAGINLTHLYRGKIPFLWYIRRDMGIVNKMLRGLAMGSASPDEVYGGTHEKPWVAGVDNKNRVVRSDTAKNLHEAIGRGMADRFAEIALTRARRAA